MPAYTPFFILSFSGEPIAIWNAMVVIDGLPRFLFFPSIPVRWFEIMNLS